MDGFGTVSSMKSGNDDDEDDLTFRAATGEIFQVVFLPSSFSSCLPYLTAV